jgi:hypothetical protein
MSATGDKKKFLPVRDTARGSANARLRVAKDGVADVKEGVADVRAEPGRRSAPLTGQDARGSAVQVAAEGDTPVTTESITRSRSKTTEKEL